MEKIKTINQTQQKLRLQEYACLYMSETVFCYLLYVKALSSIILRHVDEWPWGTGIVKMNLNTIFEVK